MQFFLNLNLLVLNEWKDVVINRGKTKEKIDLIDCTIAALISEYAKAESPGLKYNNQGMVWINHDYLLKQMPLLRIKKDALDKRLKRLVDANIIERSIEQVDMTGRRSYYKMSSEYREIEDWWKRYLDIQQNNTLSQLEKDSKMQLLAKKKPKIRATVKSYGNVNRGENGKFSPATVDSYGNVPVTSGGSLPEIFTVDSYTKTIKTNINSATTGEDSKQSVPILCPACKQSAIQDCIKRNKFCSHCGHQYTGTAKEHFDSVFNTKVEKHA